MNRKIGIAVVGLVCVGFLAFALFRARSRPGGSPLQAAIESVVSDPATFAKKRFTGGIGAIFVIDPASGLPKINGVIGGSPAEEAGLRDGDVVVGINGAPTKGKLMKQIIDEVRGLSVASVTLTVQRQATNFECVIHRASWNALEKKQGQTLTP